MLPAECLEIDVLAAAMEDGHGFVEGAGRLWEPSLFVSDIGRERERWQQRLRGVAVCVM